MVILLNGCGSAGKTSIARSIQHLSASLWLTLGVDTCIDLMPPTKIESYVTFTPGYSLQERTVSVSATSEGACLFNALPRMAAVLADVGHNLIIDEVLLDDAALQQYQEAFKGHLFYYVGVFCDLATMQERELLRGDRHIGLAAYQSGRVHQGRRAEYDYAVDTTQRSPFAAAQQILAHIEKTRREVPLVPAIAAKS